MKRNYHKSVRKIFNKKPKLIDNEAKSLNNEMK